MKVHLDPADPARLFVFRADGAFLCMAEDPGRTGRDRAAVAVQAKAVAREADSTARSRARDLQRDHVPLRTMEDVLIAEAQEAGKVVALPRRGETCETPALLEAGKAARAAQAAGGGAPGGALSARAKLSAAMKTCYLEKEDSA